ncbi:hypothetical protein ACEWAJ_23625, partial [Vibrio parahaemolyticus]
PDASPLPNLFSFFTEPAAGFKLCSFMFLILNLRGITPRYFNLQSVNLQSVNLQSEKYSDS